MTTDRIRDELLVLRAQQGDAEAFAELVARMTPVLVRHAARVLGAQDGAGDAAQEAWLAIVRGLHRLADPAAFPAWALCIAGRAAQDLQRRAGRRERSERAALTAADATRATAAPAVTAAAADDEAAVLRAAVRALPPERAMVVELHYLEGLAIDEIAAVLAVPPGTVKSRLFQARAELRARLERPATAVSRPFHPES